MVKKIAKITVYALLVFILLFIIVNVLPTKRPDPLFTEAELNVRGSFSPENGFFILLGILEPSNRDPQSPDIVNQYMAYYIKGDHCSENDIRERRRKALDEIGRQKYIYPHINDWNLFQRIIKDKELIKKDNKNKFLDDRIEKAINSKIMEDLNRPDKEAIIRLGLGFRIEHQLLRYNMLAFIHGFEKDWSIAADKIIEAVDMGQRLSRSSRNYWPFSDGKEISCNALYFISEILNRSNYNIHLYEKVIERLNKHRTFDNGLKYFLMSYYFNVIKRIDIDRPELPAKLDKGICKYINAAVFYMTFDANSTIREFNNYFLDVLSDMKTLPYKRMSPAKLIKQKNPFWWFSNYAGRIHLENEAYDFYRLIDWYYLQYAKNDLVMILAMLHRDKVPYEKVQKYLDGLVKQGFIDPFTGKGYLWNTNEKIIKSKGSSKKFQHRNSSDIHYRITE